MGVVNSREHVAQPRERHLIPYYNIIIYLYIISLFSSLSIKGIT
jgi:hypothetical protein